MRRKILALLAVACLLLSGCTDWTDGSYTSIKPHTERQQQIANQNVSVATYQQLRSALIEMVESGNQSLLINVANMNQDSVEADMERVLQYITKVNPIGVYAVEKISYELGTSGGQPALSVTVEYNHNRAEILRIKQAKGRQEANEILYDALEGFETGVVMRVSQYQTTDYAQLVQNYAEEHPELIMEVPQVTVTTYPESGNDRVVEIIFTYQSSREALRTMQTRVRYLFTSAELYVIGNDADHEKYVQLYSFLMERNDYRIETSITPSYSLLVHGVGDSKAFALVYAAMCRKADLECMVVSGTCNGEPLFWNIICDDGVYYHVDLLRCHTDGAYQQMSDGDMSGYVWDYSAYPECVEPESESPQALTEPSEEPTEAE